MKTITNAQYEEYLRLKEAQRNGHLLTTDCLRMIVRCYDYDPAKIGKHFLEVYAKWRAASL